MTPISISVLLKLTSCWLIAGSPTLRYHDAEHANLLNAMWLIAVTILCVGYGDIVPNTYCGRSLAVVCGIMVSYHAIVLACYWVSYRNIVTIFLLCLYRSLMVSSYQGGMARRVFHHNQMMPFNHMIWLGAASTNRGVLATSADVYRIKLLFSD